MTWLVAYNTKSSSSCFESYSMLVGDVKIGIREMKVGSVLLVVFKAFSEFRTSIKMTKKIVYRRRREVVKVKGKRGKSQWSLLTEEMCNYFLLFLSLIVVSDINIILSLLVNKNITYVAGVYIGSVLHPVFELLQGCFSLSFYLFFASSLYLFVLKLFKLFIFLNWFFLTRTTSNWL